ncbi:MAG: IS66 family insertion sequence element accessory protein TnpB [Candidatus Zhuqueibacterota bacterium]
MHLTDRHASSRKAGNGLSGIISNARISRPDNGDAYIFINRRRDRMKLLVWDRTGFWLLYKRLEKGTFQIPPNPANQPAVELSYWAHARRYFTDGQAVAAGKA